MRLALPVVRGADGKQLRPANAARGPGGRGFALPQPAAGTPADRRCERTSPGWSSRICDAGPGPVDNLPQQYAASSATGKQHRAQNQVAVQAPPSPRVPPRCDREGRGRPHDRQRESNCVERGSRTRQRSDDLHWAQQPSLGALRTGTLKSTPASSLPGSSRLLRPASTASHSQQATAPGRGPPPSTRRRCLRSGRDDAFCPYCAWYEDSADCGQRSVGVHRERVYRAGRAGLYVQEATAVRDGGVDRPGIGRGLAE